MKEQIFELVPDEDRLVAQVDLLRYENAYLWGRVQELESRVRGLSTQLDDRDDRLQRLQSTLDVLTAGLVSARSDDRG